MRILVADDTDKVRFALRVLIEQQPGMRVVAEATDKQELSALAQAITPNIVLLDWELPGMDVADTLQDLRRCCPETRVIALSGQPEAKQGALAAGVDAFVSKAIPPDRLLKVLLEYQHANNGRQEAKDTSEVVIK